jgi:hypothetical protein
MTFILAALFGLMLTAAFVLSAYYIGYYGLHLIDKFEEWYTAKTELDKK